MIAKKLTLPENSNITECLPGWHYFDCYACELPNLDGLNTEFCARRFLFTWPRWVRFLFALRGILAKFLGLNHSDEVSTLNNLNKSSPAREGEMLSFFEVKQNQPSEMVLFAADSHLDAGLSFLLQHNDQKTVLYATTVVRFHKKRGRVYFFLIKPFHKLIMRQQLKAIQNFYSN
ncbi:MAG: DUF2867 domain-containing protein [Bacteroidota bacterium]